MELYAAIPPVLLEHGTGLLEMELLYLMLQASQIILQKISAGIISAREMNHAVRAQQIAVHALLAAPEVEEVEAVEHRSPLTLLEILME